MEAYGTLNGHIFQSQSLLFSLEVGIWLPIGCSCSCSYYAYESRGFLEVCAEILFMNGTDMTTANYTVTLSADSMSASSSAQSMCNFKYTINKQVYYLRPAGKGELDPVLGYFSRIS